MSILFFEGFETVGTETGLANQSTTRPRINLRWDEIGSGGAPSTDSYFVIDDYVDEGFAIQMGSNGFSNGNFLQWDGLPTTTTGASAAEYILGFRAHIPSTARTFNLAQIRTEANNSQHLWISITDSTDISVATNLGATHFTGTDVLTPGSWHYIELRFIIGNSPYGEVQLYVDDVEIGEATSVDTQDFYGHVDGFQLLTTNASSGEDFVGFDDIYCLEIDGTDPETFLGSRTRIRTHPPDGDGTSTDWTTSTGTSHYVLIDENGADSADYVETSTDTDEDMFDATNQVVGGDIHAIKIEAEATDTATGANNMDVRIDSNGTFAETNHAVTSTTAYAVFEHLQATDPDTGSAWTESGWNAAEVGVQFNT